MVTRRHVLALAGSLSVAGCLTGGGQDDSPGTDTPDTVTSTPTPEDTPTETEEPTETPEEDLTGEELYFNWVHGGIYDGEEHEEILEEVQGTGPESISFNEINDALEQGGTRVEQVANAVETAAHQYTQGDQDNDFENRHRHIMSAVHQTIEQKDDHEFEVYSMTDDARSNEFVRESLGLEYSKIWVENEQGRYDDINLSLDPQYVATHIEGTEPKTKVEKSLQDQRVVERYGDNSAHDIETIQYSIERIGEKDEADEIYEGWLEEFENYMFAEEEGYAIPSTREDWEKFHEGIEEGPDVVLNLNEAYHNSEYAENGEIAGFTVEQDGSISMQDTSEGEMSQLVE